MDLATLLASRLENLKRAPQGGWTARCPCCAADNHDKEGNHLRVYANGAFVCAKIKKDGPGGAPIDHNRYVRAWLYQDADPDTLAALDVEVIDPEPKLEVDTVYPESMLAKLVSDHRYWLNRGISEEVLRRMGGGLAPTEERSKLSGRYVFPVRDEKGRIIGWTGRLVSEDSFGPTWKHLVRSSRCVFPHHDAAEEIRRTRVAVLDESVGDGLSLASVGIRNRLDLLGLNLNARILGFLVSVKPRKIVISTNNDAVDPNRKAQNDDEGNKAAAKLTAKLCPFFGEGVVMTRLPQTRKDWNKVLVENPDEIRAFKAEIDAL